MRIIVNADDYGLNANATAAIAECFRRGIVHRTTAMVNMPYFDDALHIAHDSGFADKIGLHINLAEGYPLTEEIKGSRFWCNDDGCFKGGLWKNKLWRFWMPRDVVRLAGIEIDAQMKAFVATGLEMRHFDSHQYICSYWPLNDVVYKTACSNGFRSTRGMFSAPNRQFYCRRVEHLIDKYGLARPDALLFTKDIPKLADRFFADADIEIHCHPNYRNDKGELDNKGDLMDWNLPYDQSLRFLEEVCELQY
ncbi:MAG: ChbG/HpnK family deacetylase [Kiritimatiellia bacterium]